MNNAGGIARLWWFDAQYYNGLIESETGDLPRLDLEYCSINEISFADDGGSLSMNDSEDDHGTRYSANIILKVPKISSANNIALATVKTGLRGNKIIFIVLDNNDQYSIIGGSGSYFNVTTAADHGAVMADLNHIKLQISGDLAEDQIFIDPMLLIEGQPDYAYDLSDITGLEAGSESFGATFSVADNDAEFSLKIFRMTSISTAEELGYSSTQGGIGYIGGTDVSVSFSLSESLQPLIFYMTEVWSA